MSQILRYSFISHDRYHYITVWLVSPTVASLTQRTQACRNCCCTYLSALSLTDSSPVSKTIESPTLSPQFLSPFDHLTQCLGSPCAWPCHYLSLNSTDSPGRLHQKHVRRNCVVKIPSNALRFHGRSQSPDLLGIEVEIFCRDCTITCITLHVFHLFNDYISLSTWP